MKAFTSKEYASMTESLNEIRISSTNILELAELSSKTVKESLQKVKEHISDYSFKDVAEEIYFFKKILPSFVKELIYYSKLFDIEVQMPIGGNEFRKHFTETIVKRIQAYFTQNRFLHWYYKTDQSDYDQLLFLRNSKKLFFWHNSLTEADLYFAPPASYRFAKLQAYELLVTYLHQKKAGEIHAFTENGSQESKVRWTDSKVALIELAYAIQSRGALNNGKAEVKDVVAALQAAFNIDLGNFYGVFQQNIRIRKKNRTAYLDQLKEFLERRMDECDENPHF